MKFDDIKYRIDCLLIKLTGWYPGYIVEGYMDIINENVELTDSVEKLKASNKRLKAKLDKLK